MNNEILKQVIEALGNLESAEEGDLNALSEVVEATYKMTAKALHYLYEQFKEAGFTEEQAFELVVKMSQSNS